MNQDAPFLTKKSQTALLVKYFPMLMLFLFLPLSAIIFQIPFRQIYQTLSQLPAAASAPLVGVNPAPKPAWSRKDMFTGVWQKKFEAWFSEQIPMRTFIIRFHNQLFYQIFSKIYMYDQTIIVGKHNYLYLASFLDKYCNPENITYHASDFEQWANDLQRLANFFEKRGQKFIFIVSPSKASYFPENFPANYACATNNPRAEYLMAMKTLKNKTHIEYIDATKIIIAHKSKYGNFLFSKGGAHWTALSGEIIANELIKKISVAFHQPMHDLKFTLNASHTPIGRDNDLIETSNLLFPKENYLVPDVTYHPSPTKLAHPLTIAFVGDSFAEQIIDGIQKSQQFGPTHYYFYLTWNHFYYPAGNPLKTAIPNGPQLLESKVVVMEENESCLQRCIYIHQLAELLTHPQS